ncbi:MAG: sensor domain-containing diguanylate cyclase, partial [Actinobacteria bacterium]|nr:sensor domain-containing diguanylate cyclase [Actinomycetota bacterium]
MTRRKVIAGSLALIVAALAYSATNFLLPEGSTAALAVSDFGIMAMEGATIGLGLLAFKRAAGRDDRWLWGLLTLWAFANVLGGAGRAFYDLALGREVPSISVADIGYLLAYPLASLTLVIGAKRAAGRARTLMVALDALIFTSGLAGISWPFLLEPLARTSGPSAGFWVTLAYPVGDLVVILCFVILMFASINARLPKYMFAICAAFIVQVIADAAHVAIVSRGGAYLAGSWPAGLWTLGIALGGAAALLGMESVGGRVSEQTATSGKASLTQPVDARLNPPIAPLVLPYVSLPIVAGMIGLQLITDGPRWNKELQVLAYLGLGLVLLLLARQSLTVAQNRGLTNRLSRMSQELGQRVEDLAQLTGDLETLNAHADYLNGLKSLTEVAAESVDIACWATGSRAGWIILTEDGQEKVIAYCDDRDNADQSPPDATQQQPGEELQAVPLLARGVVIGTIFLVDPKLRNRKLDLTHMIAAHVATALDNARRYEEALRFAERDPLTGLLNHRAIHAHLIEEGGRAERNRNEVSVLMLDLDDFKLLNDTFGHPAGDRVLRRVGETARRVLRQSDRAGRVGGDELMIVLPDTGSEGAAYLSERLREELVSNPFAISE